MKAYLRQSGVRQKMLKAKKLECEEKRLYCQLNGTGSHLRVKNGIHSRQRTLI
jgi:hypothetical protein